MKTTDGLAEEWLLVGLLCPLCRDLFIEEQETQYTIIYWHTKDVQNSDGTLTSTWCEIPKSITQTEENQCS